MVNIVIGDYGYNLNFTLTGSGGTALSLTAGTALLKVGKTGINTPIITGTCTISNATGGLCYYTVKSTDFTVEGTYDYKIQVFYGGTAGNIQSASTVITSVPTDKLIVKRIAP